MTEWGGYDDKHRGEEILSECPDCHLPIYLSDTRRMLALPPGDPPLIYHSACAQRAEGIFWEKQVQGDVNRLRGCGYVCELRIIRPVR